MDDEDHNQRLEEWEQSHNFNRPHKSVNGKTPYEVLKKKLPCAI
jgi:hypothetical protein